jgi:hypothetical protein
MSKKKQVKPVEKTGNGRTREGKADFVREILTRKSNKVTMLEAIMLYIKAYPTVKSLTARHTLSWYASQLRAAGEIVTLLPRVTSGPVKSWYASQLRAAGKADKPVKPGKGKAGKVKPDKVKPGKADKAGKPGKDKADKADKADKPAADEGAEILLAAEPVPVTPDLFATPDE